MIGRSGLYQLFKLGDILMTIHKTNRSRPAFLSLENLSGSNSHSSQIPGQIFGHLHRAIAPALFPALQPEASPWLPQIRIGSPPPPLYTQYHRGECKAGGAKVSARVVQNISTANQPFIESITAGRERSICSRMVTSLMVIDTRSILLAGNPTAGPWETL